MATPLAAMAGLLAMLHSAPTAAQEGFYGSLKTGAAMPGDLDFSDRATSDLRLDSETGWTLGGALGYRFSPLLRAELALDYLDADVDGSYRENVFAVPCGTFANQPCLGPAVDGDVNALSGFAMGYFDVDTGTSLSPYLGAGLGFSRIGVDVNTTARLNNGTSSPLAIVDDSDTAFGYRATAGVSYTLKAAMIDVGYSYTRHDKSSFAAKGSAVQAFAFRPRLDSHDIKAGVRLAF
ncbi:MAG: outer membrane beta-barrel protein [Rhodospirillaceae bacterium]|nr:outer membrane beta-barrel protein [Rhodospirillaceae bacterium]